jgi:hypothetical protein
MPVGLSTMNWTQGLFRIWLLASVFWIATTSYFASRALAPFPFGGNYQYTWQIKEMPWVTDWSKPFYEIANAPSKGKFPDSFSPIEPQHIEEWDKDVKSGKMVSIHFPDESYLYVTAQLTKADQEILARTYWDQRWHRYFDKFLPWLELVFGPPLGILLAWLAIRWIGRGFVKA